VTIRILPVDEHASVRESLCPLIDRQADMEVVGEAERGRAMLICQVRAGHVYFFVYEKCRKNPSNTDPQNTTLDSTL